MPEQFDTSNDPRFVEYYKQQSASDGTAARATGIMLAVLRARARLGASIDGLRVADIGCNAGAQSECWLERGHRVDGLDISRDLVQLARERNLRFGERAHFEVGSATAMPWPDGTFDVCLLPELLEHVQDWQVCLTEAVRVLRPGGSLYLTTTNVLCPVQQEFNLPLYSWYPGWAKRICVRRATTTAPQLVNYASYPAVHWFSPYALGTFLGARGVRALDRFDLMDLSGRSPLVRSVIRTVQLIAPLRFLGHVCTPSTILFGHKTSA